VISPTHKASFYEAFLNLPAVSKCLKNPVLKRIEQELAHESPSGKTITDEEDLAQMVYESKKVAIGNHSLSLF